MTNRVVKALLPVIILLIATSHLQADVSGEISDVKLEDLRSILFNQSPNSKQREDREPALQKLLNDGTPKALALVKEFLTTPTEDRLLEMNLDNWWLKQIALVGLAKIGSKEAIDIIEQTEKWAISRNRDPVQLFSDKVPETIDIKSADAYGRDDCGCQWAMFSLQHDHSLGEDKVVLYCSSDGKTWSKPMYTQVPNRPQVWDRDRARIRILADSYILSGQGRDLPFTIPDQDVDSDKDGLKDAMEIVLETNSHKADSDGDGINDRLDSNPLTPKHQESDLSQIRQAAFFFLYGIGSRKWPIFVHDNGDFAGQEYYGSASIVIKASNVVFGRMNIEDIKVQMDSSSAATVWSRDVYGLLAGAVYELHLKKLHGKWVVTESDLTGVA